MRGALGSLIAAHLFLTRLPLPSRAAGGRDPWGGLAWFPVVGLTVGLLAAVVRWAADPVGPLFATVAACAAGPLVTGAFHEDGLADTFDGLGPLDRGRRLEVMRDSRIGAFGTLALVFSVAARVAVLAPLGGGQACALLVAGHVLGRWSTLPLARWVAPARGDGLAAGVVRADARAVALGTGAALVISTPVLWCVAPQAAACAPAM